MTTPRTLRFLGPVRPQGSYLWPPGLVGAYLSQMVMGPDDLRVAEDVINLKLEESDLITRQTGAPTSENTALFVWSTDVNRLYVRSFDGTYSSVGGPTPSDDVPQPSAVRGGTPGTSPEYSRKDHTHEGDGLGGYIYSSTRTAGIPANLTITPGDLDSKILLMFNCDLTDIDSGNHQIFIRRGNTTLVGRIFSSSEGTNRQAATVIALDAPNTRSQLVYSISTLGINANQINNALFTAYDDKRPQNDQIVGGSNDDLSYQRNHETRVFYVFQSDSTLTPPIFSATYTTNVGFGVYSPWVIDRYHSVPTGQVVWKVIATAIRPMSGDIWTVNFSPPERVVEGYNIRYRSGPDATYHAAYVVGDMFVSFRNFDGSWGPDVRIDGGANEWEHLWTNESNYNTSDYAVNVDPGINLDGFTEIKVVVRNRGYGGQIHQRDETRPMRTALIGELAADDDTSGITENQLRIAVGGNSHATSLNLTGDTGQREGWREFEGIDIVGVLHRGDMQPATSRTITKITFHRRVGNYSRAVILDIYGR